MTVMTRYVGLAAFLLVLVGGFLPWWSINGAVCIYSSCSGSNAYTSFSFSYSPYLLLDITQMALLQNYPSTPFDASFSVIPPLVIVNQASIASYVSPLFEYVAGVSCQYGCPGLSSAFLLVGSSLLFYGISLLTILVSVLKSSRRGQIAGSIFAILAVAIFLYELNTINFVSGHFSGTLKTLTIQAYWRPDIGLYLITVGAVITLLSSKVQ